MKSPITKITTAAVIAIAILLPLSYGATKLIKRFIKISQLSAANEIDFFPNYRGKPLSPDGKYFAGVNWDEELVIVDISTGEQRNLGGDYYGPVVWSADGSEIAIAKYIKNKLILVAVSLETGKAQTLMEDPPLLLDWSSDKQLILGARSQGQDFPSEVMIDLKNDEEELLTKSNLGWPSSRFSPNGESVAYVTKEDDKSILNMRQVDGTSQVKYTDFPGEIIGPIWSHDMTHIIFRGIQTGIDRSYEDLWALQIEGNRFVGSPFPVLPNVEQMKFYNCSQNGQLLYRTDLQLGGIFVLQVDPLTGKTAGVPRRIVRGGNLSQPAYCWLPDGKQIAVLKRHELSIISASSGEQIRKLSLAEIESVHRGMSWAPDGKLIVFCGRDREKRAGIFLITVKTGEIKLLVTLQGNLNVDPTWAPDSKTIAYAYESNVYIVNIEDGKAQRITPPAEEREIKDLFRHPVFAPDGHSVAYQAGRRILATNIDGQETTEIFNLRNENLSIGFFDLSPDGNHIVFSPGAEIWCAAKDGAEPFQIGDISNVGSTARVGVPKWSPKGDAIIFTVNCEKYQYWVMENFLSGVEADRLLKH